jgi:hypothetical protein
MGQGNKLISYKGFATTDDFGRGHIPSLTTVNSYRKPLRSGNAVYYDSGSISGECAFGGFSKLMGIRSLFRKLSDLLLVKRINWSVCTEEPFIWSSCPCITFNYPW